MPHSRNQCIIKTAWGGKSLHTDYRPPSARPYMMPQETQEFWDKHLQGAHGIPKAEAVRKAIADIESSTHNPELRHIR